MAQVITIWLPLNLQKPPSKATIFRNFSIICITSSTIVGNEKLFESHRMLWMYKYKYYTLSDYVVAI